MKCRSCHHELAHTLIDLGSSPPSNSYLTREAMQGPETWYPLKVLVCDRCWLVQTEDFVGAAQMFSADYAYFSSFSASWLEHADRYVVKMTERFALDASSTVVEVAANDGYLLQYVKRRGIPCYGIEPTHGTAEAARAKGLEIIEEFFGTAQAKELASRGKQADLMAANNVLAHVPDINDFVRGFAILLKPNGVATFEFPHLLNLMKLDQFDTIYHEHYSYLSLTAVQRIFEANGLRIFDVEALPTHGGSLRVFAQRTDATPRPVDERVRGTLAREESAGMRSLRFYEGFQARAQHIKMKLLAFLLDGAQKGKRVAAYGAAAKGNTMMNFAGIRADLVPYVVDRNPAKQGKFMPGSRIPIVDEATLKRDRPDYVLILPWNLKDEVAGQLSYIREWGGKFVTAVPELVIA